mmetsp:Transcript_33087/g.84003  ORF Transcript_33087/g.84003 Transcript_33087/m.84003 type:complete len:245 (+) Transcript_33087:126-860(+)
MRARRAGVSTSAWYLTRSSLANLKSMERVTAAGGGLRGLCTVSSTACLSSCDALNTRASSALCFSSARRCARSSWYLACLSWDSRLKGLNTASGAAGVDTVRPKPSMGRDSRRCAGTSCRLNACFCASSSSASSVDSGLGEVGRTSVRSAKGMDLVTRWPWGPASTMLSIWDWRMERCTSAAWRPSLDSALRRVTCDRKAAVGASRRENRLELGLAGKGLGEGLGACSGVAFAERDRCAEVGRR